MTPLSRDHKASWWMLTVTVAPLPMNQFQVFFPAPGAWYKRRSLHSVLVHYVDAFVTYGPFGSADQPLEFYTLRAEASVQLISCRVSARSSSAAGGGTSFSSSGNPILVHVGAERSI
ncbi:MAG TPA: hypothetical protein VGA62_10480, partial [Acidimicrobiia bacterium]